jgi:TPR repeat protein
MAFRLAWIAATALSLAAGLPALAEPPDPSAQWIRGAEAYEAGDLETAAAAFAECAHAGDAACQSAYGHMLFTGEGVDEDEEQALSWFRRAAERHDPYGQFKLGFMYRRGIVVEQDFARAIEMYERAAGRGFAPARAELGYMRAQGEGVPVNLGIAVTMLTRAGVEGGIPSALFSASMLVRKDTDYQGDTAGVALELLGMAAGMDFAPAMVALATMLQSGDGCDVDRVEALKWHLLASRHRDGEAAIRDLAQAWIPRLDATMSPAERAEARARADAWKPD